MAIQQTVTAVKAGGTLANFDEALAAYSTSANSAALQTTLASFRTDGDFVPNVSFDVDTQTLTMVRTWNEDAYNAYVAAQSSTRPAAKANLEADGWTVTQSVATV